MQQGNLVCGATYGAAMARKRTPSPWLASLLARAMDTAMFGGTHYGVMSHRPSSLSTGTLSVVHGYVASIHANSF
jgi:hypothetical protein